MSPLPSPIFGSALAQLYCTDEAIALRALRDFPILCPESQAMAQGSDGAFLAADPWSLTSSSANFSTQGVTQGMVMILYQPAYFVPNGEQLAVDSVTAGSCTLRRLGQPSGFGQPPGPAAGATGITFKVLTFQPQIDVACFEANEYLGIDENIPDQAPGRLYKPRELEQYAVLTVLKKVYSLENKAREGDFALKLASVSQDLDELRNRLVLRWGPLGDGSLPTTSAGARARR